MMGFVIFIHVLVTIFLCTIILMQSGRGGGLTEQFASAESIFGAKTNVFLVKSTAVLASLFLITCLSLAYLSSRQDKSLMNRRPRVPMQNMETTSQPATQSNSNAATPTDTKESTENANENATQTPAVTNSVQ